MSVVNAFAALPAVVARIKATVPRFAMVMAAPDVETALESQVQSPAAHVIYDGYGVPGLAGRAGGGRGQVVVQRLLIVIAVKNARDQARKQEAIDLAGELFMQCFEALAGWTATTQMKPLRLATAPRPLYGPAWAYVPLAFEAEIVLTQE